MNQSQKLSSELSSNSRFSSSENSSISPAVIHKFLILVLLTLALMFDTVNRQPNSDLSESPNIHERSIVK